MSVLFEARSHAFGPLTKTYAVEVQEEIFEAPEIQWYPHFDRNILSSFLPNDKRVNSEVASHEEVFEDGGGDRSTPFYKLVETLQVLMLDVRSALDKLKLHIENRKKDGLNKVPHGALKRWSSVQAHLAGPRESSEDEVSKLYSAVHDSVNALLVLLISIYNEVPEMNASYPKIFQLLGTQYSEKRILMRDEILRSAALLQRMAPLASDLKVFITSKFQKSSKFTVVRGQMDLQER